MGEEGRKLEEQEEARDKVEKETSARVSCEFYHQHGCAAGFGFTTRWKEKESIQLVSVK